MTTRGYWMQGDSTTYTAAALRDLTGLWWPGSDGVLNSGGGLKVSAQGTPNMTVACADGWAKHSGYLGHNDAAKNVTIATANASNPRIDLVVWRWQDQANGDATDSGDFYVVPGTPSATPAVPSTTGLTCEKLAQVYVAAGTASIAAAAITDVRTLVSLAGDTGWVTCGGGNASVAGTAQVKREGKVVYGKFSLTCTGGWPTSQITAFTLPDTSFAPGAAHRMGLGGAPQVTPSTLILTANPGSTSVFVGANGASAGVSLWWNGPLWRTD